MNPNYMEFKFPQVRAHPWQRVLPPSVPAEVFSLMPMLLEYNPALRSKMLPCLSDPYFDELRLPGANFGESFSVSIHAPLQ